MMDIMVSRMNERVVGNRMRQARLRKNLSVARLAQMLDTSRQQIYRLERGELRISRALALRMAPMLGITAQELLFDTPPLSPVYKAATVPVLGYVGAGTRVWFYGEEQGIDDRVPAPHNATPTMVGVEIKGDSLGALWNGWIAFYDQRRDPPTDDMAGKLCIVGAVDGRVMIKKLLRGSRPGKWHLLSPNADPILDEEVEWAAEVVAIYPRH